MSTRPSFPSLFLLAFLALTSLIPPLAAQAPDNDDCTDATLIGFGDAGRFTLTVGESGGIAGSVTDAQTGEPIAGILVRVFSTIGEDPVGLDRTGADGGYVVAGLPAGTYFLSTIDLTGQPTYLREVYDDIPCDPELDCDPPAGTPVEVVAGETVTGIDFALDREGIVSGTITDAATGAPIHDLVQVLVFTAEGREIGAVYPRLGEYQVGGLYAGTYFVTAENPRYLDELYDGIPCPRGALYQGCDPREGTPVAVVAGETPGIDFSLERRGAITGTVTAAGSGLPIELPQVEVWNEQGSVVAAGPTDDAGFYDLGGLDAGPTSSAPATSGAISTRPMTPASHRHRVGGGPGV